MLTVSNIKKTFYSKEERQDVLKNVSFSLPDKGMYFIVGKSGSGKSTLLNLIGGLDTPDSGSIEFNGLQLEKLSPKELSSYRARSIGFVFQESNLFDDLSVEDNLTIPVDRKISKAEIESILKRFDLFGLEKQKVNTLSGGEKQRVAIMRAVLKNPEMILCDEPTGSLDEENSKNIFTILKNLSKEKLVIVVSHDRKSAEDFGDGIIEIKDGVINLNNELKDTSDNKENNKKQLKISFRKQLKIAFSLMKKRPLRLVLMFLICIISFSMIGVFVSVTGLSPAETIVKEMYKDNNRLLFLYDFNHVYEEKSTAIKDKDIVCEVIQGGYLTNRKSINVPSLIKIVFPTDTSLYNSLYVIDTFVSSPNSSAFNNVNVAPFSNKTFLSSLNFPILISGPCVSSRRGIGNPSSPLIHLNTLILSSWS